MAESTYLLFELFAGHPPIEELSFAMVGSTGIHVEIMPSNKRFKLLKSHAEIADKKREYRKEYARREEVKEKAKARLNQPENIAKRKEYEALPEIRARKRLRSSIHRNMPSVLKEVNERLYNEVLSESIKRQQLLTIT